MDLSDPDRAPASLSLLVERDFVAAWWLLADAAGVDRARDGSLSWFHAGMSDPHCNAIVRASFETDADERTDRLLDAFARRAQPFLWWVLPSTEPPDLASRLEARGLVREDSWPGMAVSVDQLVPPPVVPALEIRHVADDEWFDVYLGLMAPILSPSPHFTELFARASRQIGFDEDAPETHYVGVLDGEPVATVSLVTAGGAAGVYNVAVVEAARGRGIGAAMTAHAVEQGAARGLEVATLQASSMGRRVYERLGFRFVCDLVPYRGDARSGGAAETRPPARPIGHDPCSTPRHDRNADDDEARARPGLPS